MPEWVRQFDDYIMCRKYCTERDWENWRRKKEIDDKMWKILVEKNER